MQYDILKCFLIILQIRQIFSKSYVNYTLYRGIPINQNHLDFYKNLTTMYEADFWREPGQINKPVDVMIAPKNQPSFIRDVIRHGLYLTTVIDDLQKAFNMQKVKTYIRRRTESFDWLHYFRLKDIYTWLRDLASLYPKKMKLRVIGTTVQNREIIEVMINLRDISKRDTRTLPLKKVIVEGGIHAREWVSPAFVTYFLDCVIHAPYSDDDEFKKIAYLYEWHFVPVLNPDGYEHTHNQDRLWRKNRNGYGVDLNRNFGYNFGAVGVSFNPKSETYCGKQAFSENETKAMASLIRANKANLEFFISFHAYGQYIIIPYADKTTHVENYGEVKLMSQIAAKHLQRSYGTMYSIGTAYDTVGYLTSGITADWVKHNFHTPVVLTFELRDSGNYGFALPPNLILPTCIETMEAMKSLLAPRKKDWRIMALSNGNTLLAHIVVVICNCLLIIILNFDYLMSFIVN